ncbi:MAG: glycoside hydrolase family 140 protein [Clostridia bacterium]|nr:glycoside hydrolase family 140 protein [Clostridia bacterium]
MDTVTPEEKQAATWQDALEYPSSYQMGYMRSFMEQLEWYRLIPRFNNPAYFVPSSNGYAYCAGNKENTEMVVYFYSYTDESVAERLNTEKNGGVMTGTVGSLVPGAEYTYRWFDPVNGEYTEEGAFKASALGTWFAGLRPDDTDYVLLIQKA